MRRWALAIVVWVCSTPGWPAAASAAPATIVCDREQPTLVQLAAKELRRYVYLRTGQRLPISAQMPAGQSGLIVVGTKDAAAIRRSVDEPLRAAISELAPEQYRIKSLRRPQGTVLVVAGGCPVGTLYGAYRLAERFGVRFYLHGDVVPDERVALNLPNVDETGRPLFDRRGIQPFHDFPEGPDWWDADGHKQILAQLPKLRMNFFGLHTYPEGPVGPEPLVWIGSSADILSGARVRFSYPARHFTTLNGTWGYRAVATGKYAYGAATLFDRDDYGVDYMRGMSPWPANGEQSNELFARMGERLGDTFRFARSMGIKTCLGTETPLTVPKQLGTRLKAQGHDPARAAELLYEGMFRRIAQTHPLDYYWFWTPERWTWHGTKPEQVEATLADLRAALAAYQKVKPPFALATCGWVLGPPSDRALFDRVLPKSMPLSCINRQVGREPVEPGFAQVQGRPKWAIPWLEDDPAMTAPQLWVGRMRRDAADSLAYGCTGLMGIHWRTRILAPNVSALAQAAWDQSAWNPRLANHPLPAPPAETGSRRRGFLRTADFYADWAAAEFGSEAAGPIAALFVKIDGELPRPADWVDGPGDLKPDPRPWSEVAKLYAFVDELAGLETRVTGRGNRERFAYWLDNFRYLRDMGQLDCTWARFNAALARAKAEKDPQARKRLAREQALPQRKEMVRLLGEVHRHLLATVSTMGELGTVTNWQQHVMPKVFAAPGEELAKLLGEPLPSDAQPDARCPAEPRLVVPVVRTSLMPGEPLRLTAMVVAAEPEEIVLHWRRLGQGEFQHVLMARVARSVYAVALPAGEIGADVEYYIQARLCCGRSLAFPPNAPETCQTVVVVGRDEG
jgi:hypothetical protein